MFARIAVDYNSPRLDHIKCNLMCLLSIVKTTKMSSLIQTPHYEVAICELGIQCQDVPVSIAPCGRIVLLLDCTMTVVGDFWVASVSVRPYLKPPPPPPSLSSAVEINPVPTWIRPVLVVLTPPRGCGPAVALIVSWHSLGCCQRVDASHRAIPLCMDPIWPPLEVISGGSTL